MNDYRRSNSSWLICQLLCFSLLLQGTGIAQALPLPPKQTFVSLEDPVQSPASTDTGLIERFVDGASAASDALGGWLESPWASTRGAGEQIAQAGGMLPLPPRLMSAFLGASSRGQTGPPSPPGMKGAQTNRIPKVESDRLAFAHKAATEEIPLFAGYNLISIPEEPADPDPAAVFAAIAGQLDRVEAYDACDLADPWKLYDPADPAASDLTVADHEIGMWVNATAAAVLPSDGTLPETTTLDLCVGWNLIGFPAGQARHPLAVLAPIAGKWQRLFGYDILDHEDPWEVYDPNVPEWANDLQLMQPGRGYWILITEAVTLDIANDDAPPYVEIHSPAEMDTVFDFTEVVATVRSKILDHWQLEARPLYGGATTTVATGIVPAEAEPLAEFDPTMLLNGIYELTLRATDFQGRSAATSVNVVVEGEQKIGHVRLSFLDTELNLSHLAMKVIRTYDSRGRRDQGDFGYGWNLSMSDVKVQENITPGDNWRGTTTGGSIPTYCIESALPHIVAVTFSSGEVFRYRVALDPQCTIAAPPQAVELSLELVSGPEDAELVPEGRRTDLLVVGSFPGPVQLFDLDTDLPSDPESYALTLRDDTRLVLSEDSGLVSLTELNGRSLEFSPQGIIHSKGHEIDFVRDGQGRITEITTITGESLLYEYDTAGDLVAVTDEVGDKVRFTYLEDHLLHEIITPDGTRILANEYDDDSRLIGSCDQLDRCHQVSHDLTGNVETITKPNGAQVIMTYDDRGQVVSRSNNLGHTSLFEYTPEGQVKKITDPLGHTTELTWQNGDLIAITEPHEAGEDPADYTRSYTYNGRGQMTSVTFPSGGGLKMVYDAAGNKTSMTDENDVPLLTSEYDTEGRPTADANPFGTLTYDEYDAFDNPERIENESFTLLLDHDAFGRVISEDDGLLTTAYSYPEPRQVELDQSGFETQTLSIDGGDSFARWTEGTRVLYDIDKDPLGRANSLSGGTGQASFERDPAGLLDAATIDGRAERYERDAVERITRIVRAGRPDTELTYDAAGQVTEMREGDSRLSFTYRPNGDVATITDVLDRTWTHQLTPTTRTVLDPLDRTTVEHLTPQGLVERQVFDDGSERSWTYALPNGLVDGEEHPSTIVDEVGRSRSYTYGARMALASATDLAGTPYTYSADRGQLAGVAGPTGLSMSYTYDGALRPRFFTREDGGVEELRYPGPVGDLPEMRVLPSGREISFTYDDFTEIASLTSSDGDSETFVWARPGAIASATGAAGTTTTTYEPVYRLPERITLPSGQSITYRYDDHGRLETIDAEAPGGIVRTTTYAYDLAGRVTSVTDPLGGVTELEYDLANRPMLRTLPNGVVTDYVYDVRDRIETITHSDPGGAVIESYDYERSDSGEPELVTFADGSSVDFVYDDALRLSEERYLTPAGAVSEVISYTYDLAGNRLTRTTSGGTETYAYGAGHRLSTVTLGGDTRSFTMDDDGRVVGITESGEAHALSYDFRDRLTTVTTGGQEQIRYTLDAEGRRVAAVSGGQQLDYLVARTGSGSSRGPHLVTEGNALVAGYVYALGIPLLRYDATGAPVYYLEDALGSIVALADGAGAAVARFDYDGFGNLRSGSSPVADDAGGDFGFHGSWLDATTGLYHLSAREYDPRIGRFLSRDPLPFQAAQPEMSHPYVFVANNPQLFSDPSGLYGGINEQSVMSAIQSALGRIKARFVKEVAQELIQRAKREGIELAIDTALTSANLESVFFQGLNAFSYRDELDALAKAGQIFEAALTKTFCNLDSIGWADRLWFQTVINFQTGHPTNSGRNCEDIKAGRTGTRATRLETKPDMVMMMSADSRPLKGPKDYGRAFFIGDAKLSLSSAVSQWSGSKRNQYLAVRRYAWKHALAVATVWSYNEGKAGSCRALQKLFQRGNTGPNDNSRTVVIGVTLMGGLCTRWDQGKKKK